MARNGAILRAGGDLPVPDGTACAARRGRQSFASFRQPPLHSRSNCGSQGGRLFSRMRKTPSRSPRMIWPTGRRLSPVDGSTNVGHPANHAVGLLTPLKTLVLQIFCHARSCTGHDPALGVRGDEGFFHKWVSTTVSYAFYSVGIAAMFPTVVGMANALLAATPRNVRGLSGNFRWWHGRTALAAQRRIGRL